MEVFSSESRILCSKSQLRSEKQVELFNHEQGGDTDVLPGM
jgi:hypothetical protein